MHLCFQGAGPWTTLSRWSLLWSPKAQLEEFVELLTSFDQVEEWPLFRVLGISNSSILSFFFWQNLKNLVEKCQVWACQSCKIWLPRPTATRKGRPVIFFHFSSWSKVCKMWSRFNADWWGFKTTFMFNSFTCSVFRMLTKNIWFFTYFSDDLHGDVGFHLGRRQLGFSTLLALPGPQVWCHRKWSGLSSCKLHPANKNLNWHIVGWFVGQQKADLTRKWSDLAKKKDNEMLYARSCSEPVCQCCVAVNTSDEETKNENGRRKVDPMKHGKTSWLGCKPLV